MKPTLHELDGPVHDTGYGCHFQRALDGSVRIAIGTDSAELPPAEWAKAVAFVSARGESLDLTGEALQFHQRRE